MKRTLIHLTAQQHEALRTLAFETKSTMSEHIRTAIDNYLNEINKKEEKHHMKSMKRTLETNFSIDLLEEGELRVHEVEFEEGDIQILYKGEYWTYDEEDEPINQGKRTLDVIAVEPVTMENYHDVGFDTMILL